MCRKEPVWAGKSLTHAKLATLLTACTTVSITCDQKCLSLSLMAMLASVQNGKTEYKSVTVADNATAEEFMDFYLDDSSRPTWVCSSHRHACTYLTVTIPAAGADMSLRPVDGYLIALQS